MTNRDIVFFNAAKEMSKLSDYSPHKIGCVITHKNRIVSSGYNSRKSNPLQKRYNRIRFNTDSTPHSCHAETKALLPILKDKNIDRSRLRVYLFREHADGSLALSKPCPSCMKMLKDAGIKQIYFTDEGSYCEKYIVEQRTRYLAKEETEEIAGA